MDKENLTLNQLAAFASEQETRFGTMLGKIFRTENERLNRLEQEDEKKGGGDYWSQLYRQCHEYASGAKTLDALLEECQSLDDKKRSSYEGRLKKWRRLIPGRYLDSGFNGLCTVRDFELRYRVCYVAELRGRRTAVFVYAGSNPPLSQVGVDVIAAAIFSSPEAVSKGILSVAVVDLGREDLYLYRRLTPAISKELAWQIMRFREVWQGYLARRRTDLR